jgi:hypothetical protein
MDIFSVLIFGSTPDVSLDICENVRNISVLVEYVPIKEAMKNLPFTEREKVIFRSLKVTANFFLVIRRPYSSC